jgi:hypothetical protein
LSVFIIGFWFISGDAPENLFTHKIPNSIIRQRIIAFKQSDRCNTNFTTALTKGDRKEFLSLTAAKERLWKLVQPTAGSLRPGRRAAPLLQTRPAFVADAPQAPPAPSDQPPV